MGAGMKAISLWQPWASAMALGLKRIETRGWSTEYRGPLAIHAAKRWTQAEQAFAAQHRLRYLPLGAVVAIGRLVNVIPTSGLCAPPLLISDEERTWGDYGPGRFAWIFDNIQTLAIPVPFKGRQGFFEIPDELLAIGNRS